MAFGYVDLDALDRGIADAFRAVTKGNPQAVVDKSGVKRLFAAAMADGAITENEAKALMLIVDNARFNEDAIKQFVEELAKAVESDAFSRGAKRLADKQLADVYHALSSAISGQINFTSPGTNFTYAPTQYAGVAKLISNGDIAVFEIATAGFGDVVKMPSGLYQSDKNTLLLRSEGMPPKTKNLTIVHECTHAIQDWQDVVCKTQHAEADAYVAGAVAGISMKLPMEGVPLFGTAAKAAEKMLNNQKWNEEYDALVTDVLKQPEYKKKKNVPYTTTIKGERNEKKQMDDLIAAAAKRAEAVGSYLAESIRQLRRGVGDSLPGR